MSEVVCPEFKKAFIDERKPFPFLDQLEFDHAPASYAYNVLGSQIWINKHRYPTSGALDIYGMSERIGVELKTGVKGVSLGGADWRNHAKPVIIYLGEEPQEYPVTYGHEVGHIYLKESRGIDDAEQVSNDSVERFCDYFGEAMAMPLSDFQEITNPTPQGIIELSREYKVTLSDILSRLEGLGKIPERVRLISKIRRTGGLITSVFCGHCRWNYGSCEDMSTPQVELDFSPFDVFVGGGCGGELKRRGIM